MLGVGAEPPTRRVGARTPNLGARGGEETFRRGLRSGSLAAKEAVADGVLGRVPAAAFDRRGVRSIRTVVEDEKGSTRLASAAVEIE
jgi:hypothetical protein